MFLFVIFAILCFIDHSNAQTECLETAQGINYLGKQTISVNGPCAYWYNATGNANYNQDSQFKDITVQNAKNYCRNPPASGANPYQSSPWCWLQSNSATWAFCNIPLCTSLGVCRTTYLGETYTGNVSKSAFGNDCIPWASTGQFSTWPITTETITAASNYCRNPDKNVLGLWCYTQLSPLKWEPCMTALCESTLDCVNGKAPYSFKSLTANEQYMDTCAMWSTVAQASIPFYNSASPRPSLLSNAAPATNVTPVFSTSLMPDLTLTEAQNYCRNPDNDTVGAWCYVLNAGSYSKKYCKTPCSGIWACLYDRVGQYYQGTVSVTESGDTCQRWDSQTPNPSTYVASNFPDGSVTAASNYCRNPDGNLGGPWCYRSTTVGPPNFGYCTLPTCLQTPPIPALRTSTQTSLCQNTSAGLEYTGTIATTISGKNCQNWNAVIPQANPYFNRPNLFNTATMAEAANYCRNPNRLLTGPWCYTTDPGTVSESCNLLKCSPGPIQNCRLTLAGTEYNGTINTTASGQPCLLWAQIPNLSYLPSQFADGFISSALNYCRNPQKPNWLGCFCYVSNGGTSAVEAPCVVPMCSSSQCRSTSEGYTYTGTQATTLSGNACVSWKSQVASIDPDMLPDATIDAASNYCRNPNKNNANDGPFCSYSSSGTLLQETCGINYCTTQCRNTQLGTDYAGIISRSTKMLLCRTWIDPSNTLYRDPTKLNAVTLDGASNYCRNPDSDPLGLWCYTGVNTKSYCFVPPCGPSANCYTPNNAWLYNGKVNVTDSGLPCAKWQGYTSPGLPGPSFSEALLPEPDAQSVNYCRAPTTNATYLAKPWCYLDVLNLPLGVTPTVSYGFCNVTICVTTTAPSTTSTSTALTTTTTSKAIIVNVSSTICYTPANVASYNGFNNVTVSGTPCLQWASVSQTVLSQTNGPTFNAAFLPGETAAQANNYCRVPTNQAQYSSQPWCYVSPATATQAEALQNFGFCSVNFCNSTYSTEIFVNPAYNVFVAFAIVISTLSLSHSALVLLDGSMTSAMTVTSYQNRPLPEYPSDVMNATQTDGNQALHPDSVQGNMLTGGGQSMVPSNIIGQGNVGFGDSLIVAQQMQMNAAGVPPVTGSGLKVIGNVVESNIRSDVISNIQASKNASIPVAYQNKVVAEGFDQTYSLNAGGNMEGITAPNVRNASASVLHAYSGPKVVGEGFDEEYTYTVSGNLGGQRVQQINNEAFDHNLRGNQLGNANELKIIAQGSDSIYYGGSGAGVTGNGGMKIVALGSGEENANVKVAGLGNSSAAEGNVSSMLWDQNSGGMGGGSSRGNGVSGGFGLKIIAQGSEAVYSGSGAMGGRSYGGGAMVGGSSGGGAMVGGSSGGGAMGGVSSGGGATGGGAMGGGAMGRVSSGGGTMGGGAMGGGAMINGSSGGGAMGGGSSGGGAMGGESSGGGAMGGGSSGGGAMGGRSRGGGTLGGQSKAVYYDINLKDAVASSAGNNNVSELRKSATVGPSKSSPNETQARMETSASSNQDGLDSNQLTQKEDIYYSILEDWNPFGST